MLQFTGSSAITLTVKPHLSNFRARSCPHLNNNRCFLNPKLWYLSCILSGRARHCGFPTYRLFATNFILNAYLHEKAKICKRARSAEKGRNACAWRHQILVASKRSTTGVSSNAPSRQQRLPPPFAATRDHYLRYLLLDRRHSLRRPLPPLTRNGLGISSCSGSQIGTSPPLLRFSFLVSSTIPFSTLCA